MITITVTEAKKKWCPFFRVLQGAYGNISNRDSADEDQFFERTPTCIVSDCMAWVIVKDDIGYCGLIK